jgi:Kinesin motor domain
MVQVTSNTSLAIDSPQGKKLFVFDRVFNPEITQEGVWEYLHDSVNAFVQGYNVSLLAYGQSGAGKSYTMGTSGPAEQGDPDIMGKDTSRPIMSCHLLLAELSNAVSQV